MKICEPKTTGTLWATPSLLGTPLPFNQEEDDEEGEPSKLGKEVDGAMKEKNWTFDKAINFQMWRQATAN